MSDIISDIEKVKWINIQDSFVVFDVETTGLDSRTDRILEIGAVLFEKDEYLATGEIKTFQCFIKQKNPIPPEVTKINKITDEMVADGEDEFRALELFFDFVGAKDLYAYNAKFDKSFINAMARRSGYSREPVVDHVFDIYKYIRDEYIIKPNYKLTNVAKYLNIDTSDSHRAVGDSVLALKSYIHVAQVITMLRQKMHIEQQNWIKDNITDRKEINNLSEKEKIQYKPQAEESSRLEKYSIEIGVAAVFIIFILILIFSK